MAEGRCALVILPCQNGDAGRLLASVEAARRHGMGDFIDLVRVEHAAEGGFASTMKAAALGAEEGGYAWLLAVSEAETVAPDIFEQAAPALRVADAVWGGAAAVQPGGAGPRYERITRLAAQDYPTFFHLALRWWIGPTHFVRPAAALASLEGSRGEDAYADYLLAMWKGGRALKLSHGLTAVHGTLPPVPEAVRARLLAVLDREPVFNTVTAAGRSLRLPYTGRNPVVERDHTRGQFFEQAELSWLAEHLPRGMRIVDAGANTGNHTVFFAAAMEAASVLPIEPDPRACAAIRSAVSENDLRNVDLRLLGFAVGSADDQMRPVFSEGGGLGATRLLPDPAGTIPVRPLDALVEGRVDFLKIDVEGMEMAVLAGASATIATQRPAIFIEVLDETVPEFLKWLDSNDYRIEKLFPDKTHSNYLVRPIGAPA